MFLLMFRKVKSLLLVVATHYGPAAALENGWSDLLCCCLYFLFTYLFPVFVPQRHLGDAAKKAIGKLTTRTVKKGDKVGLCPLLLLSFLYSRTEFTILVLTSTKMFKMNIELWTEYSVTHDSIL